ncbi:MAG: phospholipase D-like domain-containing protein [Candidatus Saccharibacteria bacterium]|nr:phospholipase D-like domain-containing protein [Candidatus Saccharibacteria bacterium]
MFNLRKSNSKLYDQNTFDDQLMRDLQKAQRSVIIESPFLRTARVEKFIPLFHHLKNRGVKILLNTKPPEEHDEIYKLQAQESLGLLQSAGVEVLFTVKHHRKLAIIDRQIIYEGGLNILSYRDSCEIMRRTASALEAEMLIDFIGLNKFMEVK